MAMTRTIAAALGAWMLMMPAGGAAQDDPLRAFEEAAGAYVALHRHVERGLPPPAISPDAGEIFDAVDAMAAAMRAARPDAQEGDVFNPKASVLLRLRIRMSILDAGDDPAAIKRLLTGDLPIEPGVPLPAVNGGFSWELPAFMPSCVLAALPVLPPELEYRFVERDLVLIDMHADLVVDVLRNAFPDPDRWHHEPRGGRRYVDRAVPHAHPEV
jgi:hypothetical protein